MGNNPSQFFWANQGSPDNPCADYQIKRSMRFRMENAPKMTCTMPNPTGDIQTVSMWVKRATGGPNGLLTGDAGLMQAYVSPSNNTNFGSAYGVIRFQGIYPAGTQNFEGNNLLIGSASETTPGGGMTVQTFSDPMCWYHIVVQTSGPANTLYLWVNGVEMDFINGAKQNFGLGGDVILGQHLAGEAQFNGYITEVYGVDGLSLGPETFGFFDDRGVWTVKDSNTVKAAISAAGGFGTNGFYLDMDPDSVSGNLMLDQSGNSNNFTCTNLTLSDPSSYNNDLVRDTPTLNRATLNPNTQFYDDGSFTNSGVIKLEDADLTYEGQGAYYQIAQTYGLNYPEKFYFENFNELVYGVGNAVTLGYRINGGQFQQMTNNLVPGVVAGGQLNSGYFGVAVDTRAETVDEQGNPCLKIALWLYVVGQSIDDWSYSLDTAPPANPIYNSEIDNGNVAAIGMSQPFQPTDQVEIYIASINGPVNNANGHCNFGQFDFLIPEDKYPESFKTLDSVATPLPNIQNSFNSQRCLKGAGASIENIAKGVSPGTVWPGAPDNTGFPNGLYLIMQTVENTTVGQFDNQMADSMTGFNKTSCWPDVPQQSNSRVQPPQPFVTPASPSMAYCWRADEAWSSTQGNVINQTGFRNQAAGFAMSTMTAPASGNAIVAAGTPNGLADMVWWRNMDPDKTNIFMGFPDCPGAENIDGPSGGGAHGFLEFNTDQQYVGGGGVQANGGGLLEFDAGRFPVNDEMTVYCWEEVTGYSQFGFYDGNGNEDGVLISTSFRPQWILIKNLETSQQSGNTAFVIFDATTRPNNTEGNDLYLSSSSGFGGYRQDGGGNIAVYSQSFKLTTADEQLNRNGAQYYYAAFAQCPLSGVCLKPAPAR